MCWGSLVSLVVMVHGISTASQEADLAVADYAVHSAWYLQEGAQQFSKSNSKRRSEKPSHWRPVMVLIINLLRSRLTLETGSRIHGRII